VSVKLPLSWKETDVNPKDAELILAASSGNVELVKRLLDRKNLDINVKNQWGVTPLLGAVRYGHLEVVKMLLSREDVDIDVEDKGGSTALISANSFGYSEILKLLLCETTWKSMSITTVA